MERGGDHAHLMAEIVLLALSHQEYGDLVDAVMDLVTHSLSNAFVSLSVDEGQQVGNYARTGRRGDLPWARDLGQYLSEMHSRPHALGASTRPIEQHVLVPRAWLLSFPAQTRSGRKCLLTLGWPAPVKLDDGETQFFMRLVRQLLLVLDYALLSRKTDQLESIDRLTGLPNHYRLLEILDYEMRRHRFLAKRLMLIQLDVEGLDQINRTYGRSYGSHILVKLAGQLRELTRPIDIIGRCGMDEFAVVLPETAEDEAETLAHHIEEQIMNMNFAGGSVSVSIGVVQFQPDESLTAEGLLHRAEQVVQDNKRQERNWNSLLAVDAQRARITGHL